MTSTIEERIKLLTPTQKKVYYVIQESIKISRQDLIIKTGIHQKLISREIQPILDLKLAEKDKEGRNVIYHKVTLLPGITRPPAAAETTMFEEPETEELPQEASKPSTYTHLTNRKTRREYYIKIIKQKWEETHQATSKKDLQKITETFCSDLCEVLAPAVQSGELEKYKAHRQVFYYPTGFNLEMQEERFTEFDQWINRIEPLKQFLDVKKTKRASEKSIADYGYNVIYLYKFLSGGEANYVIRRVESIRTRDIRNYLKDLVENGGKRKKKISTNSIRHIIDALKAYFKFCVREGYIQKNPMDQIDKPKPESPKRTWVDIEDEFKRMEQAASDPTDKMLLWFLLFTGVRDDEAANAKLSQIDWKRGELTIPAVKSKNRKERKVKIDRLKVLKMLQTYIEEYRKPRDAAETALFINLNGERLQGQVITYRIRQLRKKAGIKKAITPHSFRRTFARTMFYVNGMSPTDIQVLMGHATLQMTLEYIGIKAEEAYKSYDEKSHNLVHLIDKAPKPEPKLEIEEAK